MLCHDHVFRGENILHQCSGSGSGTIRLMNSGMRRAALFPMSGGCSHCRGTARSHCRRHGCHEQQQPSRPSLWQQLPDEVRSRHARALRLLLIRGVPDCQHGSRASAVTTAVTHADTHSAASQHHLSDCEGD